jgi:uncharacterized membrane protein YgaE (UPF0421/DUF939 family)
VRALRASGVTLLQTAAAAGIAWFVAHDVLHHRNGFFAPIAAVIALGLAAPGRRTTRAVELVLGVGVGIAIGDALIAAIGQGPAQVALVVLLAMSGTILLGGGPLVVSQAAGSAVLVATVPTVGSAVVPTRFVDALVGGMVGLAVLAVVPHDPVRVARRESAPLFAELAATLEDVADALAALDLQAATAALERARTLDALAMRLDSSLELAAETTRLAPRHWHERGRIERYAIAATQLGLAVRNVRVLARAAIRAVELEPEIPAGLVASVRALAASVRAIEPVLELGEGEDAARASAIDAAVGATRALDANAGFSIDVLVGQVRSTATDLLRALGEPQGEAVAEIRAAAGERR